ncbi:MAG: terpene cyclase/mutase family protein [Candidatus Aenigmarchaeota archaeon]|nr:terpene cyclase/mutase family protein [Candidatus Aenigmarchaeota archaeon]
MKELLERAGDYLVKEQKQDGSWEVKKVFHNEPLDWQKDIVVISQNIRTLIMLNSHKYIKSINKGIYFCCKQEFNNNVPIIWNTSKLKLLKYLSSMEEEKEKIFKIIMKNENGGYWYYFPKTFNLANYCAISSIYDMISSIKANQIKRWIIENKAKDKKGWGREEHSDKSSYAFTSNMIESLILLGEDPLSKDIQIASKFIKESQNKDGSWKNSNLTSTKSTTYATSLAALVVMITSDNPFNENIEKAIKYLLNSSHKNGGWPLIKGEKPEYYSTYYVIRTLVFYNYLKEKWKYLRGMKIKPQRAAAFLFRGFEKYLKERFRILMLENTLNSNILGNTKQAKERRYDILKILANGPREIADIIDELKKNEKYSYLTKKYHITQIKFDLEHLKNLNLVGKHKYEYYAISGLI